jgi:hypothetical protein
MQHSVPATTGKLRVTGSALLLVRPWGIAMPKSQALVLIVTFVMCSAGARADVLSASCSNIHGVRIDDTGRKLETDTDGLTGTTWSYSWDTNSKSATLILQSGGGTTPTTETAFVHAMSGGISFVSVLSGATWVHTLYAEGRRLLVSQHSYGLAANGKRLSGKMMTGDCQMTIR